MSDESTEDQIEIDPDHPWVAAALNVPMQPTTCGVDLESAELTVEGRKVNAALLAVADGSGVKTAFLPPQMLAGLVARGIEILEEWENEKNKGLVIPKGAVDISKFAEEMGKLRG